MTGALYSTSNNLRASGSHYAVGAGTELADLGYALSGSTSGTLTVNAIALTLAGFDAAGKTYDGNTTASINNAGSLSGVLGSDVVTASNSGATFDTKDVGPGKTVTLNGVALGDTDAGNYSIASTATDTAAISPKTVTLSASKTYDASTSLTGAVSVGTGVSGETLSYSGATANDAHAATAGKFINAITLVDGSGLASNYALPALDSANAAVTINAATLTATLSNTGVAKTYDGTTDAPLGFAPGFSVSGLLGADRAALTSGSASYNSKDVASANAVTVSGLAIASVTGSAGSQASDYVLASNSASAVASIAPKALTVRANNDAKFVTQTDAVGYAGASYNGLVLGETAADLGGTLSIVRIGAGSPNSADPALTYAGVLQPSGHSSANYSYTYQQGDYRIVPANELLVRVAAVSDTYGTATTYTVGSAEYWNGSSAVALGNIVANGSNNFTVNDGAGGAATFTLAALAASTSSAGKLVAGSYQIGTSGLVTETSANFSNTVTVTGSHTVASQALNLGASGISKVYDGSAAMTGVNLGLSGAVSGDVLDVAGSGSFSQAGVGLNLAYSITGIQLSGADAGNYHLTGGNTLSGNNGQINQATLTVTAPTVSRAYDGTLQAAGTAAVGTLAGAGAGDHVNSAAVLAFTDKHAGLANKTVRASGLTLVNANNQDVTGNYAISYADNTQSTITPKTVVLSAAGVSKVYDGNTAFTLSAAALQLLSQQLGVAGDTVSAANGAFATKNVGTAKTANLGNATVNDGNRGANYQLSFAATADNSISRLASVVWSGPAQGGNWFDPANWAGGAVPDLGNVANVTIPLGANVVFGNTIVAPAEAGAVQIDSLGSTGSLTQTAGVLQVGSGGVLLGGFTQTGGSTSVAGDFTTTDRFSQDGSAGGQLTVQGNANITNSVGTTQMGNLSSHGNLSINSTDGDISQQIGTALLVGGSTHMQATRNGRPADIALNNPGNDFVGAVQAQGQNVRLQDGNGSLVLGNMTATGSLQLAARGDIRQLVGSALQTNQGAQASSTHGRVTLLNTANSFGSGGLTLVDTSNRGVTPVVAVPPPPVPVSVQPLPLPGDAPAPLMGGSNGVGIQVEILRAPSAQDMGLVVVSVPRGTTTSGNGFSFVIPSQITQAAGANTLRFGLPDGSALPAWLRFEPTTMRLVASAVPDAGLPVKLLVQFGDQQVTIIVSERTQ